MRGHTPRWVQSAELIPQAKMECIKYEGSHTSVGSESRADPTGKANVHKQRVGSQLVGQSVYLYKPRSDKVRL